MRTHLRLWHESDADRLSKGFPDRYPEAACGQAANEEAVDLPLFIKADDRCELCVLVAKDRKLIPND